MNLPVLENSVPRCDLFPEEAARGPLNAVLVSVLTEISREAFCSVGVSGRSGHTYGMRRFPTISQVFAGKDY